MFTTTTPSTSRTPNERTSKIIPPIDQTHWVGICQNKVSYPIRQMRKFSRAYVARGTRGVYIVYKQRHPYRRKKNDRTRRDTWPASFRQTCLRASIYRVFPKCLFVCALNGDAICKIGTYDAISIHALWMYRRCLCAEKNPEIRILVCGNTHTHTNVQADTAQCHNSINKAI